uniref:Reverse transcriptase domain-containing protein n=1 Tax=Tanacetum cinerariifolium TaxID=118510 RepID=A0A6L2L1V8_TANCI|nr:reverse transcriptase domain-containing protein [Tanacetum cinerariifolium]
MRTRSSSNLPVKSPPDLSTSNPKRRNRRRSKQPFILEASLVHTMANRRTMAELLRAPTEGYAEAIVVLPILTEQFELKHSLINMIISDQLLGLEKDNPHDHMRWFNNITSTIKYKDVSNSAIKLMLFLFSLAWDRYKYLLRACPHHGFTELHQLDTFYNALNPTDQDFLNYAAGGNLLERRTQDVLTIIENKSKVCNSRNKSVVSQVKSSDANSNSSSEIAKLTHAVNQQTSACLAAGGNTFPELRDNIQGYVAAAAVNYNQGNFVYRPLEQSYQAPTQQNQVVPLSELEKVKRMNEANMKGSLPSNTISNPKGELKAIITRSDLSEYTIKVPPPPVQKYKPPSQRDYIVHQRDPLHPNIHYPSRMLKQKQQEKDEVQIHKFWQMFKQLHIYITLANALILIPKYQKMLKPLLSNMEKLLELANTPLNENCSAVILKKLPKKRGDPGKFLILCGFNELKCKALANLGASINLMPLSVWKKLGLPELISTRMTLELANRAIYTRAGIARDVFISVGKFTFPADFVIVNYESYPRVPFILGRPFLRTAHALINVHGEEMILHDGDERLTLNMRHDTSSYSSQPQKESISLINICDDLNEDFLEELCARNFQSGNPTFPSHPKLTSPEVKDDVFDPDQVLKPLFHSPILVEDSESFLKKTDTSLSYLDISFPEFETFIDHTKETSSGKLTSVVMKDNLAEPRVHVPNVLTTHPTLMLDSDFIPSDNSLLEFETFYFDIEEKNSGSTTIHVDISLSDLESFNFDFKPDPGELTSIVDSRICENVPSATNMNLPPEEDHSPLFAYVVWICIFFLTYPVVLPHLFSFGNEDTIFDPGIANYHFSSLLLDVSHLCETFMKLNVYPKLLNVSPMEILSSSCSLMEQ